MSLPADPFDASRAWFVPAHSDAQRMPVAGRMVVNETLDGGSIFASHDDGLPKSDAFHLVSRHGLVVSRDGKTLAIGSTTGGLWVSENVGQSWLCLLRDLPPIAVLRLE